MAPAWLVALINQKGGVGKTTTAVNLGAALAALGKRVLIIDTDTQKASASTWLGRSPQDLGENAIELADVILEPKRTAQAIYPSSITGVDVLPCTARMVAALKAVEDRPVPDYMMERVIANLPDRYDYVFIDCPPALSRVVIATIIAVDEVIVPMRAHTMSIDAVGETLQLIDEIIESGARRKPEPPRVRPLITEPENTKLGQEAINEVRNALDGVFKTMVRKNIKLAEAYGFRRSIFEHAKRSNGASDFRNIALELTGASA